MMARVRVGDTAALAAVYDQYCALVHGICAHLLGVDAAADVCQDVFMKLWERPDGFDPGRGSLRTYLAVMARRRSIDELRSGGRRRTREKRSTREGGSFPAPDVEEAALAMIASERVRDAMTRLPADQREAIELAYLEGFTCHQIAEAIGAPVGTAKSRLRLGLGKLAHEFSAGGTTTHGARRS